MTIHTIFDLKKGPERYIATLLLNQAPLQIVSSQVLGVQCTWLASSFSAAGSHLSFGFNDIIISSKSYS